MVHIGMEKMYIIKAYPPNWPKIAKTFPYIVGRPGILYAYGHKLYNPSGVNVQSWILAHEEVHGKRQCDGLVPRHANETPVQAWWDHYLREPSFRLIEEVHAHRAEFRAFIAPGQMWLRTDGSYEAALENIARRLSGPLYGHMISLERAKELITAKEYNDEVK